MSYIIDVTPSCQRAIGKACKKNPVLREILQKKMNEIAIFPSRYHPLKYGLKGERSVHIIKSFVLKFEINEARKIITFLVFRHHDKAYKI